MTASFSLHAQSPPAHAESRLERYEASWAVPSAHAGALMLGMRTVEAIIWPNPFADVSWAEIRQSYRETYTLPPKWDGSRAAFEWDGDPWYVNVLGHGAFGSELYFRARLCQKPPWQSLVFATAASAVWEYGVEATAVRPSALDLWYTPVAGLILGEARYVGFVAAGRLRDRVARSVLTALLDPFGELERAAGTRC
jgi:hypothetical protein